MATKKEWKNVDIQHEGNKVILPEGMSYDDAITWLTRKQNEENKDVGFKEEFEGVYPVDALVAMHRALSDIYGWIDLRPTPGFFSSTPPAMMPIRVGPNETIHVPYGRMIVPNIRGYLQTNVQFTPKIKFVLTALIANKDVPRLKEIAGKMREFIRNNSIYKSKAVRLSWDWEREGRDFDMTEDSPRFLDLMDVDSEELIFSDDVANQISVGLWTPIEDTGACRANKVPLKRGVLLEGPYGVGKTLAALVTAKKATENGWTFVYLNNVLDLKRGVEFARFYAPAVVFAEDVDRVMGTQERNEEIDMILNCLDGIDAKQHEIITVLTTNHVERLNRAFVRPGRLDTVVSVRPPDGAAAVKLVQLYGRGLLSPDTDYRKIADKLAGKIPAVIREIVERAKIATVARTHSADIQGRVLENDIVYAATSIETHNALMEEPKPSLKKQYVVHLHVNRPLGADDGDGKDVIEIGGERYKLTD